MIDPEHVRAYMRGFYGYGSYSARYWFIGLEEGGASSVSDLKGRIDVWRALGEHEVEDLSAFHQAMGSGSWFGATPKRQATWARLIQILLAAEGRPSSSEDILQYQSTRLGRSNGESLLAELMPLPAKNLNTWYASELNLPELRSRSDYRKAIAPGRIAHLKEKIVQHQPHAVIFYGARRGWPQLLDIDFEPGNACDRGRLGPTRLLAMKHPAAYGVRREEWESVARSIG